ncbi:MAG TPA: glycosyltransferase, partial [Actinomycetota bacterium]
MKALVVAHVGETLGHLARALPVADALRRRGIEVHIAAAPRARPTSVQSCPGIPFHPVRWNWSHNQVGSVPMSDYLRELVRTNIELRAILTALTPDVVVSFPGVFTAQLAASLGIPHMAVLHGPYLSPIVELRDPSPLEIAVLTVATDLMCGGTWDLILRHVARALGLPELTYERFLQTERIAIPQPALSLRGGENLGRCDFIAASLGPAIPPAIELGSGCCYISFGTGKPCPLDDVVRVASSAFARVLVSTNQAG